MRIQNQIIVFALLISACAFGEDIIPGVLTFTPPSDFDSFGASHDPGDNPFAGVGQLREYLSHDGRQINLSLRHVGFTVGEGKRVTYKKLDDAGLKEEMLTYCKSLRNISNLTAVTDTKIGGQKALVVSYDVIVPDAQVHLYIDLYWARIQTNKVIEVQLSAQSNSGLPSLRQSLSKLKIAKSFSP